MTDLLALPPRSKDGDVHVVVESPAGATVKLKYDPTLRVFMVSPWHFYSYQGGLSLIR